ncbi:MarR family winged helix-turn-helix transcriptional regulator [Secundilactobacillus kimchicus]|uniref:MarR family winged helix-turn-helix transcriptional regulator n=1 Tax=Secundilactobacillus kimchicus TaxID=528209 RepID=UPI0006D24609|nr:MarR family transcriptional regulator [Secundilactobacillus kimchicus]
MTTESDALVSQLNITARKLQNRLNELLKPLNLTANNYYFILKIDTKEPLTQDQLYKRIYLSHSNVTRRLDQLIQLGLVQKNA